MNFKWKDQVTQKEKATCVASVLNMLSNKDFTGARVSVVRI
jgi:hypothetical protein